VGRGLDDMLYLSWPHGALQPVFVRRKEAFPPILHTVFTMELFCCSTKLFAWGVELSVFVLPVFRKSKTCSEDYPGEN
jgi:hypothetical protein